MTSQTTAPPDVWAKWGAMWAQPDTPSTQTAKSLAQTANKALPFSKATKILDIGCGTGALASELISNYSAQLPSSTQIIESDLSPGMIAQVQAQKDKESGWERVVPVVYDATDLSALADGSVSHVLSNFALFVIPEKGWVEAYRVLQPGGVLVTSAMTPADASWITVMETITQIRPEKTMPGPEEKFRSVEGLKGVISEAGFKDVEAYKVQLYLPFETAEKLVDLLVESMPFVPFLTKDMNQEEMREWRELMLTDVREKYPDGRLPGAAIIGCGRK